MLSSHQFGTLQMFWSSCAYHEKNISDTIKKVPLFLEDGKINPTAKNLIQQTMLPTFDYTTSSEGRYQHPGLNDEEIDQFFEAMRNAPRSEQFFLLAPHIQQNESTILQYINTRFAFNIFGYIKNQRSFENYTVSVVTGEMVPSFGMMQTFLNILYKQQAVTLNPVLGLSSLEDLEHLTQRDIALQFPGVLLPDKADGVLAPAHQFTFHDFYHAIFGSSVPPTHRELFNKMGQIANQCKFTNLHERFVDREFKFYTQSLTHPEKLTQFFWDTVEHGIKKVDGTDEQKLQFLIKASQQLDNDHIFAAGNQRLNQLIGQFSQTNRHTSMCSIQ